VLLGDLRLGLAQDVEVVHTNLCAQTRLALGKKAERTVHGNRISGRVRLGGRVAVGNRKDEADGLIALSAADHAPDLVLNLAQLRQTSVRAHF